jgi:molecular chaperone DnaJ
MDMMGEDVLARINISFMEAAHGVKKTISYNHISKCSPCSGTGAKPGSKPKKCAQCRGTGQVN